MSVITPADRAAVTQMVRESLDAWGPTSERELSYRLDETPRAVGHALNRLLVLREIDVIRADDCRVTVLYATRTS